MIVRKAATAFGFVFALWGGGAFAATSETFAAQAATATLITAEDAVAPNASVLSAGISIALEDGWKTYWRSPGEVGLPPDIDWSRSTNVASAELMWPAPTRFRAFGIENYGYADHVTFPVRLTLTDPGQPAILNADVFLLVCADVCIPQDLSLTLSLPAGTGIDQIAAAQIADWSAKVPVDGTTRSLSAKAYIAADGASLTVEMSGAANWQNTEIFPEDRDGIAFGTPDMRPLADNAGIWASFPVFGDGIDAANLALTATTDDMAVTFVPETVQIATAAIAPPFTQDRASTGIGQRLRMLLIAFLGGLILNLMPCVLPVLSIKFSSALKMSDRSLAQTRMGFLASAAGTVSFMWILALGVLALQLLGVSVGWGLQFQNAYFLIALILVLGLFSANLFGLFEINLPQSLTTRLSNSGGRGYVGDFTTGVFGAVMATPCSAPLLGTAVAFALTGAPIDVILVFTALGVGLALPYLVIALKPQWVTRLPKPGRWMLLLKFVLGLMLLGTMVWLLWILQSVSNPTVMWAVLAVFLAVLACVVWRSRNQAVVPLVLATVLAVSSFALPAGFAKPAVAASSDLNWAVFSRRDIAQHVSQGHVVFVDVTADWCLTCKANKILVLDRDPVAPLLAAADVIAMRADWTRPDPAIQDFLETYGRFGIPFNIVYGPASPEGIPLSEVLTNASVMDALSQAAAKP